MRFPAVNDTNLHPTSHLSLLQIIGQIFAFNKGVPLFNTFFRGKPINSGLRNWRQETRKIALLYGMKSISISWTVWASVTDRRTGRF